ncbi:MAG TPA: HAD family hydrolase [Spirochaetota bacterium]
MKYVAFDMDGTLYDCSDAIEDAYARASVILAKETGKAIVPPSIEKIRTVLGNTAVHFFGPLFPALDASYLSLVDRTCTGELVVNVRARKGVLYDGVHDLFGELTSRGYGILIASNGQREYLDAILETYDLSRFLAHEPVTVNYSSIHTKGEILAHYREKLGISGQLVMVGDRHSDLTAARENNAYFIGCAFGHAGDDEIAGADSIVHSISGISPAVCHSA